MSRPGIEPGPLRWGESTPERANRTACLQLFGTSTYERATSGECSRQVYYWLWIINKKWQNIAQIFTMLRIRNIYPVSRILIFSLIPDPGSKNNKREGWKNVSCHTFFCSHKFHKIEKLFNFWNAEEKNLAQFSMNYITFYPKLCHQALNSKGLGSGIPDPGPGVKKAQDPGSGSATLKFLNIKCEYPVRTCVPAQNPRGAGQTLTCPRPASTAHTWSYCTPPD